MQRMRKALVCDLAFLIIHFCSASRACSESDPVQPQKTFMSYLYPIVRPVSPSDFVTPHCHGDQSSSQDLRARK